MVSGRIKFVYNFCWSGWFLFGSGWFLFVSGPFGLFLVPVGWLRPYAVGFLFVRVDFCVV